MNIVMRYYEDSTSAVDLSRIPTTLEYLASGKLQEKLSAWAKQHRHTAKFRTLEKYLITKAQSRLEADKIIVAARHTFVVMALIQLVFHRKFAALLARLLKKCSFELLVPLPSLVDQSLEFRFIMQGT